MGFNDDFIDPLVEEILTDVAGSFFENRRALDEKIDLFNRYVKELQSKEADVRKPATLLNHLLFQGRQSPAFFKMLGVDGDLFIAAGTLGPSEAVEYRPLAIGRRSRFIKLVCAAYADLQHAVAVYLHGRFRADMTAKPEPTHAYYHLVLSMHRLINREIERINSSISPSCALQFAKRLNPQIAQKEQITGGGTVDGRSLDEKLCYRPIELEALSLRQYPDLPAIGTVSTDIKGFCKSLYGTDARHIKAVLTDIKSRLSASRK